jgi:hypothetical protein
VKILASIHESYYLSFLKILFRFFFSIKDYFSKTDQKA